MQKIWIPTTTPSGRISNEPEERRKKEREKMPFIVANYVYASSQGQRTHSARTNKLIISCVFQFKMVSQVHSITNNTLVTIGPVKGFTGYNPFLTIMCNISYT